jgi:hypothetical protein
MFIAEKCKDNRNIVVCMMLIFNEVVGYIKRNINNDYTATVSNIKGKMALNSAMKFLMFYRHEITNGFDQYHSLEDIREIIDGAICDVCGDSNSHATSDELSDILGKMISEGNGIPKASKEEVETLYNFFVILKKRTENFLIERIQAV